MCCVIDCIFNRLMAVFLLICSLVIMIAVSVANLSSECEFSPLITWAIYAQFAWVVVKPCINICGLRILTAFVTFFLSAVITSLLISLNKESCRIDNMDASHILSAVGFGQGTILVISIIVVFKEVGMKDDTVPYQQQQDYDQ